MRGPLFFGSSNDLVDRFSYSADPTSVTIDLRAAQIWDASTVAALDSVKMRYAWRGATVTIEGLDERSRAFHSRLTGRLGRGERDGRIGVLQHPRHPSSRAFAQRAARSVGT